MGHLWLCVVVVALTSCHVAVSTDDALLSVGPKECAKGIDFWCQSLESASSCGAVKHCIQNVWPRRVLPQDNSSICDLCKEMVKEARDQLQSNETQEEIKEVFEGTCKIYFPVKAIAEECIRMVDDYIPDLIEELSSMMSPQTVCATAWLCNSNKFLEMLGVKEFIQVGTVCDECVHTATNFINKVQNETNDQFQAQLINVCNHIPSVERPCKMGVEMFGKSLYSTVISMQPRELCQLTGLCDGLPSKRIYKLTLADGSQVSTKKKQDGTHVMRAGDAPECDFCKQMLSHLKDLIVANSTEAEVRDTLLSICDRLGAMSDSCKTYVNEYFDEIYNFLINEMDPDLLCGALGFCPTSVQSVPLATMRPSQRLIGTDEGKANSAPLTKLLPAQRFTGKDESNSIDWSPASVQLPETRLIPQVLVPGLVADAQRIGSVVPHTVSCALCEYALHELQAILGDNKTEEAIKEALAQLCTRLPATLTEECKEYVKDYSDLIINLIEQEIDPSVMCVQMGLCSSRGVNLLPTSAPMPSLTLKLPMSKPHLTLSSGGMKKAVKGLSTCEVCNLVISYVDSMLQDPPTEEAIVHALDHVCGLVPKTVYQQCVGLIETYGQSALTYIATITDSKKVCQAMNVCARVKGQVELLGGNKCTYGPSYWCQSVFHARACKAEQHCRDKVWK